MSCWRRTGLASLVSAGGLLLAWSSPGATARTYKVVIDKMKFGQVPAGLVKGDVLIWVNRDILRHSATATSHVFDIDLPPGTSKRMTLTKSGTFRFVCRYHPGMQGALAIR